MGVVILVDVLLLVNNSGKEENIKIKEVQLNYPGNFLKIARRGPGLF